MTETKWTPGPHEVVVGEYSTPTKIYGQYQSRPNQILCIIVGDSSEAEANAQLYAAAPDLYAATDLPGINGIEFSDTMNDDSKMELHLTVGQFRALQAARRKARGE